MMSRFGYLRVMQAAGFVYSSLMGSSSPLSSSSSALGIAAPRRTDHSDDLARFIGAWDDRTASRLRKNLDHFETIDESIWK